MQSDRSAAGISTQESADALALAHWVYRYYCYNLSKHVTHVVANSK